MEKTTLLIGNARFIAEMQGMLSPITGVLESGADGKEALHKMKVKTVRTIILDDDSCPEPLRKSVLVRGKHAGKDVMIVSSDNNPDKILACRKAGASDFVIKPTRVREFLIRFNAVRYKKTRMVCLGGGTGLFNLLMGLKTLRNVLLFSVVSTTDSGGSSGQLRVDFGILPPGDLRRSLIALSNAPALMNQVMQHRFKKGGHLAGHSFGNLFLAALAELRGSMTEAIEGIGDLLYIQGIVLPAVTNQITLCARFKNGKTIRGESAIDLCKDRDPILQIEKIWHEPEAICGKDVFSVILNADVVILGPGDLYTSLMTSLVVRDIRKALILTKAKKIYIGNLMSKPGETTGYDAAMYLKEINRYLGGDYLDYAIFSNTHLSLLSLERYAKKGQVPVAVGSRHSLRRITGSKVILENVGHETELVRHDSEKIARVIEKIITGKI